MYVQTQLLDTFQQSFRIRVTAAHEIVSQIESLP